MERRRTTFRPPSAPPRRRLPKYVYWRRRALTLLAFLTILYVGYLGVTLVAALNNPSYGITSQARFAEWGRNHGLGGIVTWAEAEYYKLNPPKTGGEPPRNAFGSGSAVVKLPKGSNTLTPPLSMPSPAGQALPGEGVFHPVGRRTAAGQPAIYEAYVRPNAVNTSYVVGVAWMDPTILQAQLYSGSQIPGGGPFTYSAPIKPAAATTLVAAFNAGFRIQDANGGYYTQGKQLIKLRDGAASVVIYKDGSMTVGKWGSSSIFSLKDNQIASVRQNLNLIVDNGQLAPGLTSPNAIAWGKTLGGTFNVWRSGLGVTTNGGLIYVGGPSLSIYDLAHVLQLAGCANAMELDINTDWVQYTSYRAPVGFPVTGADGTNLLKGMLGNPGRFFANWWTRDFFTMSLRPQFANGVTSTTLKKLG